RRGGGGVARGGDACVALAGGGRHSREQDEGKAPREQDEGDAHTQGVPTPRFIHSCPYGIRSGSQGAATQYLPL
ncbi:MAG TPA: hypothetical protein VF026_33150, partial [Ktedonobacteraceae bacterium]